MSECVAVKLTNEGGRRDTIHNNSDKLSKNPAGESLEKLFCGETEHKTFKLAPHVHILRQKYNNNYV